MSTNTRGTGHATAAGGDTEADVIVLGVGTCREDLSLRLLGAGLDVVGIEAALIAQHDLCLPNIPQRNWRSDRSVWTWTVYSD
jgi:hypothetical protein